MSVVIVFAATMCISRRRPRHANARPGPPVDAGVLVPTARQEPTVMVLLPAFPPHRAPLEDCLGRKRLRAVTPARVLAITGMISCGCGGRAADAPARESGGAPASDRVLPLGTYVVRSRARFTGATLRYYDAGYGGSPSGELAVAGVGRYTGTISPRARDTVVIGMACRCPVGDDGAYDDLTYDGRYAVSDLGGGRYELRQTDNERAPAVDTVERRR